MCVTSQTIAFAGLSCVPPQKVREGSDPPLTFDRYYLMKDGGFERSFDFSKGERLSFLTVPAKET